MHRLAIHPSLSRSSTTSSGDTIACIHGVRFLSLTWVILGHTFMSYVPGSPWSVFINNLLEAVSPAGPLSYTAMAVVYNGQVSVN